MSFRDVAFGRGSPDQVFKLPEQEIASRLENIENETNGAMSFHESVYSSQIHRHQDFDRAELLTAICPHEEE